MGAQSTKAPVTSLVAPDSSATSFSRLCAGTSSIDSTRDSADCSGANAAFGAKSWRANVAGAATFGAAAIALWTARTGPQSFFTQFVELDGQRSRQSLSPADANRTTLPAHDAGSDFPASIGADIAGVFLAPLTAAKLPNADIGSILGLVSRTLAPHAQLFIEAVQGHGDHGDHGDHAADGFQAPGTGGIVHAEFHSSDNLTVLNRDPVFPVVAIPEPATLALTMTGLLAIAAYARRRAVIPRR
jgi:hypothetical protein